MTLLLYYFLTNFRERLILRYNIISYEADENIFKFNFNRWHRPDG